MEINATAMQAYNNQSITTPQISENQTDEELREACDGFETIFVKMMLDSMRDTITKSDLLENGMAGDIYEDLLYDEYSEILSKSTDFGVSEMLYSQLSTQGPNLDLDL